jgi:valyl-tRNA synthetase
LKRQRKEQEKLRNVIVANEKKLSDEKFLSRAPEEVVHQARENLASLQKQLQSVEDIIGQLSTD